MCTLYRAVCRIYFKLSHLQNFNLGQDTRAGKDINISFAGTAPEAWAVSCRHSAVRRPTHYTLKIAHQNHSTIRCDLSLKFSTMRRASFHD